MNQAIVKGSKMVGSWRRCEPQEKQRETEKSVVLGGMNGGNLPLRNMKPTVLSVCTHFFDLRRHVV